jgi:hypothetical protein
MADEPRTRPLLAPQPEIFLIAPDEKSPLQAKLQDSSYRVRTINSLADAEECLHERIPAPSSSMWIFPRGRTRR